MSFKFTCPICNSELECDDSLENKITECPLCHNEVVPVKDARENPPSAIPATPKVEARTQSKSKTADKTTQTSSSQNKVFGILDFIDKSTSIQSGEEFKRPLLSKIFWILGRIYLAFAIVSFAIGFLVSLFILFTRGNAGSGLPILLGISSSIYLFISCLFHFGISQLIDFIGKICFNSDKILELMQRRDR